MEGNIQIELIVNSGVFIRTSNSTILIDGIFGKNAYFSDIPKEVKKAVFGMGGRYADIDYLIFSHRHDDHFSNIYLEEYLQNNSVKRVFLPVGNEGSIENPSFITSSHSSQVELIELAFGEIYEVRLGAGNTLRFFRSSHIGGNEYIDVEHYTYILTVDRQSFLFSADADAVIENFNMNFIDRKIEAVFVNVLFFKSKKGQEILDKILNPKMVVIYHLPFNADDIYNLRLMAKQTIKKTINKEYEIVLLKDYRQQLSFGN